MIILSGPKIDYTKNKNHFSHEIVKKAWHLYKTQGKSYENQ